MFFFSGKRKQTESMYSMYSMCSDENLLYGRAGMKYKESMSRTNFQLSIGFAHTSTNALHQHMFERWWQVRSKNKTENTEHNQRVHFGVLIMRACNIDLHLKIWSSALQANRTHIGLVWFFFLFETGIKWRCTKNSPHIHICTNECENPLLKHRSNASKCRRTAYMRSVFSE